MEPWQIALIVVVLAVVAGGAVLLLFRQRQRTERLTGRFGPEYRHALEDHGDRRAAETELEARQRRVEELEIRTLTAEEHDRFASAWRRVQARFVDDPSGTISEADRLVEQLMETRGYPVAEGFEQRAADVSVGHGQVAIEYREAHAIAERHAAEGVDTETLRQALVHYRALFDELLEVDQRAPVEASS